MLITIAMERQALFPAHMAAVGLKGTHCRDLALAARASGKPVKSSPEINHRNVRERWDRKVKFAIKIKLSTTPGKYGAKPQHSNVEESVLVLPTASTCVTDNSEPPPKQGTVPFE